MGWEKTYYERTLPRPRFAQEAVFKNNIYRLLRKYKYGHVTKLSKGLLVNFIKCDNVRKCSFLLKDAYLSRWSQRAP